MSKSIECRRSTLTIMGIGNPVTIEGGNVVCAGNESIGIYMAM